MENKELNLDNTQLNEQTEQIAKKPSPSPWMAKARQSVAAILASAQSLVPSAATTAAVGGGAAMLTSCETEQVDPDDKLEQIQNANQPGVIRKLNDASIGTAFVVNGYSTVGGATMPTEIKIDLTGNDLTSTFVRNDWIKFFMTRFPKDFGPTPTMADVDKFLEDNPEHIRARFGVTRSGQESSIWNESYTDNATSLLNQTLDVKKDIIDNPEFADCFVERTVTRNGESIVVKELKPNNQIIYSVIMLSDRVSADGLLRFAPNFVPAYLRAASNDNVPR